MKTVVVGLSGGVDSSVSAALLKEQGYRVLGLFMKNWEEEDGPCPSKEDFDDVVAVCEELDIPYYSVNFVKEYWNEVFSDFLEGYKQGSTPNPDILCNRQIKFKHFMRKAMDLGADYLATGHYCQSVDGMLLRGKDPSKDQSYFLHQVPKEALEKTLFPIGNMLKSEVRDMATQMGLPVAKKRDSTGLCFIGKRDFRPFLQQFLPEEKGLFVTPEGEVVGEHSGAFLYTIGQRKGMGIGGPGDPWFVVAKDCKNNTVTVVQGEEHPALYASTLITKTPFWISGEPPAAAFSCTAKIRYRQEDQNADVSFLPDGSLEVIFHAPQRAISPGQSVVFYQDELCLGGAEIQQAVDNNR